MLISDVEVLSCPNASIAGLTGLSSLTSLTKLDLTGNAGLPCGDLETLQATLPQLQITEPNYCAPGGGDPSAPLKSLYNALGQRVAKTVNNDPASTIHFIYDQQGRVLAEINAATGATLWEYIYVNGEQVALVDATQTANEAIYYVHNDHLGTQQKITNQSQQVVWAADYESFGKVSVTTRTIANNVRFPGQYADGESGLHYNCFRDYDPSTGRYLESDPIGLTSGLNTYAYVQGNPLTYTDPTGEFIVIPMLWGAGVGAVTDIALQLALNGGNLKCINWGQVGVSAGLGAIGGGAGGYLAKLRQVRQAYQSGLAAARKSGLSPYQAWAARRAIGLGLKQSTPIGARNWIYGRNLREYGDELGPKWNSAAMSDVTKTLTDTNRLIDKLLRLPSRGLPSSRGAAAGALSVAAGDCLCQ